MREIVLDTETTGLEANNGDRVFELGCVELWNHMATGRTFYALLDPERPLSQKSIEITGFTDDQLVGKPKFAQVAREFLDFIADDHLVIHNAAFDIGFLNMELGRLGVGPIAPSRVVDTLAMARKRFPGAQANLDALCRRFSIDNSNREKHGALLDAELLAEVYLAMTGGQVTLALDAGNARPGPGGHARRRRAAGPVPVRVVAPSTAELAAHEAALARVRDASGGSCLWLEERETAEPGGSAAAP